MALKRKSLLNLEAAEAIALQGLAFLAGDGPRLGRFLSLTGIGPVELRAMAGTRQLQAAVIEHLLADESLLLVFASETAADPGLLAPALGLLQAAGDP
jgi:hypothetical protein